MSMLFDVDFFYRDFGKFLKISSESILFHYRFAGIIGSKYDFKISQKKLSEQFGCTERSIIRRLNPLIEFGLMISCADERDKRKNRYSFPEFLPNYYQDRASYGINPEQLLQILPPILLNHLQQNNFTLQKYVTDVSCISTKYVTDVSPNLKEYVTHVSGIFSKSAEISNNNEELTSTPKKANRKRDINRKDINRKRGKVSPHFKPTDKHFSLAEEFQLDIKDECQRFIDYYLGTGKLMINWNSTFNNWLRRSKDYKDDRVNKQGKKESGIKRSLRLCLN